MGCLHIGVTAKRFDPGIKIVGNNEKDILGHSTQRIKKALKARQVNFFVVGVQKGGTTALDRHLRRHPSIQMARVKEVHFFDKEDGIDWDAPDYTPLHDQFDWAVDDVVRGEVTPIYIYWPRSLERLRAYNPEARLIVGLRHPAYRAYSHWRMETTRGAEELSFEDAISPAGRTRVSASPNCAHRVYSYIERGMYSIQIRHMLNLFPSDHILFFRTDELWTDPRSVIERIEDFLAVPHAGIVKEHEYIVPVDGRALGKISDTTLKGLQAVFHCDIEETQDLTGLDLFDWRGDTYREAMDA